MTDEKISYQKIEKKITNVDLFNAMEWGYIHCEKGHNIQHARIEFEKLMTVK